MTYFLSFTPSAKEDLQLLKKTAHLQKRYRAVVKSLRFLVDNPKHPSLQTHQYHSFQGPGGEKIFEAYAEQDTPAAYRIFFYYGQDRGEIVITAITPHP
jgi:mRNA-degrading endonuclease RelE of RelBE toxin-antitoxin system